ncbi:DUF916 and DUF3324 domain-containing protein [Carnobacterium maltaromaticum]|uniref:DUF916 and DUF3324 domain-containing protein n=1 Tax=Carnobacterium maltaromaticum TaxID=2751 RepID=UPI000E743628|nr:DUF916 and DUF3324 domain-containing protein [Carnobacterium maltaromaticum]AOA03381.1 cell surface protein [Carnobacterium maltaromaticum]
MKITKKMALFVMSIGLLFMSFSMRVSAEENPSNVAISAVIPDNQIDKNKTYFDLLMTPGEEQELEVVLTNSSDEAITMESSVNSAITNDNGVVDYSQAKPKYDKTLKHPLSSIATFEKEQVIPANSKKTMKIKIKMPETEIKGIIAGGVYLSAKDNEDAEKNDDSGVQIKNKYVYVVGIQLRTREDISDVQPDLVLDKKLIQPKQVNYRNYLGINLQNKEPVFIRDLTVEAKIYKKGSNEVFVESKNENLKMAPNSNFNYGVNWNNKEFEAGTYRAKVTAIAKDYDNKTWNWDEEFTITAKDAKDAKDLNEKAIDLEVEKTPIWIYFAIAGGILLLLIVIIYLIKRHIDKKKEAQRKAQLRKKRELKKKKEAQKKRVKHKEND